MREKAKDVKRDKCPGCGKMCTGRLAMVRVICGLEMETFCFTCPGCGAWWINTTLPKYTEKDFEKGERDGR